MLLTRRCPACCGAAFGHHGDLGAEVVAVAAHGGLLVLSISTQKPLQHPPAPLTLNLRLHLQDKQRGRQTERGASLSRHETQDLANLS